VDPVPDLLLPRKSGSTGNRTWNLWICSQELCPLDHRGGHRHRINLFIHVWQRYPWGPDTGLTVPVVTKLNSSRRDWEWVSFSLQSSAVKHAAFGCRWYTHSADFNTLLRIVIMRAQKPVHLTAGSFYIVSLATFADVRPTVLWLIPVSYELFGHYEWYVQGNV
jgi:hypothetical protein